MTHLVSTHLVSTHARLAIPPPPCSSPTPGPFATAIDAAPRAAAWPASPLSFAPLLPPERVRAEHGHRVPHDAHRRDGVSEDEDAHRGGEDVLQISQHLHVQRADVRGDRELREIDGEGARAVRDGSAASAPSPRTASSRR